MRETYYIYSRRTGRKKIDRHVPGYTRKETAEKRISDFKFYNLNPDREYWIEHEPQPTTT